MRVVSCALALVSWGGIAAAADYAALRSADLDGRSAGASALVLERDAFTVHFGPGRFHFLAPVDGHTFGAVFLGQGRWKLSPSTESERRHLGLVLGDSAQNGVSDGFDSMVLFFLDGTMAEILEHGALETGAVDARAAATYDRYLQAQREQWRKNMHLRVYGTVSQSGVSDGFLALVPLYLEFDKGKFLQIAKSPFKGNMTHPVDVTLALPDKPKRVRVNLQHEVLALEEP